MDRRTNLQMVPKCLPASRGGLEPKWLKCLSVPVAVAGIFTLLKGEMLANFSRGSCRPVVAPWDRLAVFLRSPGRISAILLRGRLGPRISRTFLAIQPEKFCGELSPKIRRSNFEVQPRRPESFLNTISCENSFSARLLCSLRAGRLLAYKWHRLPFVEGRLRPGVGASLGSVPPVPAPFVGWLAWGRGAASPYGHLSCTRWPVRCPRFRERILRVKLRSECRPESFLKAVSL